MPKIPYIATSIVNAPTYRVRLPAGQAPGYATNCTCLADQNGPCQRIWNHVTVCSANHVTGYNEYAFCYLPDKWNMDCIRFWTRDRGVCTQSDQLHTRGHNFWPPTGPTAYKKIIQTLALQEVKFKDSFAFFCDWLRTILWRCVRACAFHLIGCLTNVSTAFGQWYDGAIFFINLCAGADGRY